jgi:hypothetical protein
VKKVTGNWLNGAWLIGERRMAGEEGRVFVFGFFSLPLTTMVRIIWPADAGLTGLMRRGRLEEMLKDGKEVKMLKRHLDYIEKSLVAQSRVVGEAGHTIHKGTPREYFIREFLEKHISERAAIGTGEVIDRNSQPSEQRNQIDIIVYRRDYPKLNLGGGIDVFFAESVMAAIEVKSRLDKGKLKKIIKAGNKIKQLRRSISGVSIGRVPPGIVNYVVAYGGPGDMSSVYRWVNEMHRDEGIEVPCLPGTRGERTKVASPSIDAIFVLGKGFLYFDNQRTGYASNGIHKEHPASRWIFADSPDGNIFLLFVFLTDVVGTCLASIPDLFPYLKGVSVQLMHGE